MLVDLVSISDKVPDSLPKLVQVFYLALGANQRNRDCRYWVKTSYNLAALENILCGTCAKDPTPQGPQQL